MLRGQPTCCCDCRDGWNHTKGHRRFWDIIAVRQVEENKIPRLEKRSCSKTRNKKSGERWMLHNKTKRILVPHSSVAPPFWFAKIVDLRDDSLEQQEFCFFCTSHTYQSPTTRFGQSDTGVERKTRWFSTEKAVAMLGKSQRNWDARVMTGRVDVVLSNE